MNVYVVRHGETEWNKKGIFQGSKDSPLSEAGQEHAEKVAMYLQKKSDANHIYASPLGRAQETAKVIAEQTGAQITTISEFAEMHFGVFEGKDKHYVESAYADFFSQRKKSTSHKLLTPYPSGESYYDVYLRVLQPLKRIVALEEPCVIVGHESVNRILRGTILKQQLEKIINNRQKNNEVITIDAKQYKERIVTV